ncbi:MAG: phosphatidylglycerophosphatase A [Candidatus Methanofastidiosia archaeon]
MQEIEIKGIRGYIEGKALIIDSEEELRVLSSGVLNGGFYKTRRIVNMQIPHDYKGKTPEDDLMEFGESTVGMMTAVDLKNLCISNLDKVCAISTAGILGKTINVVLLIDANLCSSAMVEALTGLTEAKVQALNALDLRDNSNARYGTPTDSSLVACTSRGERIRFAGSATELGKSIRKTTKSSVFGALMKEEKLKSSRTLMKRMEERGIFVKDLLDVEERLYIENEELSKHEFLRIFERELERISEDINVSSLIMAALRLDEDGKAGLIPNLKKDEFSKDPIHLLADEILGMQIASYIGGTQAIFEFLRIEREKPKIISELDVFADDAISGLLAGISAKIFSEVRR